MLRTGPVIKLTVTLDPPANIIAAQLESILRRADDLSPIMQTLPEKIIFPAVMELFATEGFGTWQFKGFQSSPPMVKTGLMKRGLTRRDAMLNTVVVTKSSVTFALNPAPYISASRAHTRKKKGGVFYPAIHQYGGSRHNRNPVLALRDEDIQRAVELIQNYIINGELE
jgi:phage gpG-like protein